MDTQNARGPAGLRGPFRAAGRRLRRTIERLAEQGRRLPPRTRRAVAVAAVAGSFLVSYGVFSAVSPQLRDWSRAWDRDVAPAPELASPPAGAGTDGGLRVEVKPAGRQEAEVPAVAAPPVAGEAVWPVAGQVIRGFGWGADETMDDYRLHTGIDIASPSGTQVRAIAGGTVSDVRRDARWGWVVEVTHAPGFASRYAGLARAAVEKGQVVEPGQALGEVGSAAVESAQPSHLHLEVIRDGEPVDPMTLFPAEGS